MIWDAHIHCNYSGDSQASAKQMIEKAIQMGLPGICFTDHHDIDYPKLPEEPDFLISFSSYFEELNRLQTAYLQKLPIHIGMELGLQPCVCEKNKEIAQSHPFDFIIGSVHVVNGVDPYYKTYYEGRSKKEAYEEYFMDTLENVKMFTNFDVLGHMDYITRYCPSKDVSYRYLDYCDYIDAILTVLIERGQGIEVNTSSLRVGLLETHPQKAILKRYKELGGEILTIGSDAHCPKDLAFGFGQIPELLKNCGFEYYSIFKNRTAEFIKLS